MFGFNNNDEVYALRQEVDDLKRMLRNQCKHENTDTELDWGMESTTTKCRDCGKVLRKEYL